MSCAWQGVCQGQPNVTVESLFQIIINLLNMDSQVKFYRDVLNLEIVYPEQSKDWSKESFVRFETGGTFLVLHAGRNTNHAGRSHGFLFGWHNLHWLVNTF